tara:strand:+ start:202 stop:483 length:282 start_codon:yes stop_codon:yes gene_type:complete
MFVKNLSINVIATFELGEYEDSQEIFDIKFLTKKVLKSKKSLIDYIKLQLDPHRELVKLSLCWNCNEDIVNQYPTIKKSIFKDNGKYFFGSWA